jgi:alpha-methylacyl-CoA racemase
MAGPLKGISIVEMGGIGPAPFAGMMLADHGAHVVRVERAGMIGFEGDPLRRSRRSIALDLKQPQAGEIVRRLAATAGGLIEGYRPGVMERLGLGPNELLKGNPKLVYGRVTGWGRTVRSRRMQGTTSTMSRSADCSTVSARRSGLRCRSIISATMRAAE